MSDLLHISDTSKSAKIVPLYNWKRKVNNRLPSKEAMQVTADGASFDFYSTRLSLYRLKHFGESKSEKHFFCPTSNLLVFCFNIGNEIHIQNRHSKEEIFCEKNSLLLLSKAGKLRLDLEGSKKYHLIFISIEKSDLNDFFSETALSSFSVLTENQPEIFSRKLNLQELQTVKKIAKSSSDMEIIGNFYLFLNYFSKKCGKLKQENVSKSKVEEWEVREITCLVSNIKENPGALYTISTMVKETGVCAPRLQNVFKQLFGMTAGAYIRDVRLVEAARLLRGRKHNISEIVYAIGFTSRSYFSRIFKDKYECLPSEYRLRFVED